MAEKKEKTLLLALFDCFQSFASGVAYFEESSDGKEYVEKLWATQAENWYIVYCGDICTLSLGKMSNKVPVAFANKTMAGKITSANLSILRDKLWLKLSGKPFETLARKQEQHLKKIIEIGVQLQNSKDNEAKKKQDSGNDFVPHKINSRRVWDAEDLISLDHLEIQINEQYDYMLQLFLNEPYEIICKRENYGYLCRIIKENKREEYSHNQILALYTGALLLGINISDDDRVRESIDANIERYLQGHFQSGDTRNQQVSKGESMSNERLPFKLKRTSPQSLFFADKKKSQSELYIEEMLEKLIEASEDDDIEDIYERVNRRVEEVIDGFWQRAVLESMNYRQFNRYVRDCQDEIAKLLPRAENRIKTNKNDDLESQKIGMIDVLRIHIIMLFLHLSLQYEYILLVQASDQIQKEASIIREDIKKKERLLEDMRDDDLVKAENELEAIMKEYGGNTV